MLSTLSSASSPLTRWASSAEPSAPRDPSCRYPWWAISCPAARIQRTDSGHRSTEKDHALRVKVEGEAGCGLGSCRPAEAFWRWVPPSGLDLSSSWAPRLPRDCPAGGPRLRVFRGGSLTSGSLPRHAPPRREDTRRALRLRQG